MPFGRDSTRKAAAKARMAVSRQTESSNDQEARLSKMREYNNVTYTAVAQENGSPKDLQPMNMDPNGVVPDVEAEREKFSDASLVSTFEDKMKSLHPSTCSTCKRKVLRFAHHRTTCKCTKAAFNPFS